MKGLICVFFATILFMGGVFAQNELPVVRATSVSVDIRDGNVLNKNSWHIMPEISLDVYVSSSKNKMVTFYTDIDSISVKVKPAMEFDFVVLLNDSVRALTRIKYGKPVFVESYMSILKSASKYNKKDYREIPKFTYQDKDDESLVKLRKMFNLDSIAGTGSEVSQILNILTWIHNLIPHDGQHNNPPIMNAVDMIEVCKKEGRGLNCRGLAIVLNECYLAMGFKARYVTCLPKVDAEVECHVINTVYSNELDKWIWVDPTFDAYLMNEKGELLGIGEVRERLINGKPLILNPTANWNREHSQYKEDYLDNYMSKNLYILECPIDSNYNLETKEANKTVRFLSLEPLDYDILRPDKIVKSGGDGMEYIWYGTNNPDVFWAKPE